jgi:hypothetical protein
VEFKVGDKIILKEEKRILLLKGGYDSNFTEQILEVKIINSISIYAAEINSNYVQIRDAINFRLATESEVKRNKINYIFRINNIRKY